MMQTNVRPLGVALLCGIAMFCAACSGSSVGGTPVSTGAGTGQSGSNGPAPSETGGVSNGAPKVPDPVDVSRFKDRPCDFLTSSQLKMLGVSAPSKADEVAGAGMLCQWPGGTDQPSVAVGLLSNLNGLSGVYGKKDQFDKFGPVPNINGFPAVKSLIGGGSPYDCAYSVGMNDHTAVYVLVSNSKNGDPCDAVLQVAKDVTLTAKGGS